MGAIAIIGFGKVGQAYQKVFPDAYIYDEPKNLGIKKQVNKCELAIVCVPTDLKDGELDMSIVENVVSWLETDYILIKSALQPGTADRLIEQTGKKIAVSVELVGEGSYFTPYWKYPDTQNPKMHQLLIVGGEDEVATRCAEILWDRMSPDIRIHITTALEAEITKLAENTYGALKVTWANVLKDLCDEYGANFIRVHQAWSEDGRVDSMHTRTTKGKRGWASKCYEKDVRAFAEISKSKMLEGMIEDNQRHQDFNR